MMMIMILLLLLILDCVNSFVCSSKRIRTSLSLSLSSTSTSTIPSTHTTISIPSSFIFITCQAGVEKLVKAEMALNQRDVFKLAFSKKGLLTFKGVNEVDPNNIIINSIFARHFGKSIGMYDLLELNDVARKLAVDVYGKKLRLHVYGRELGGMRTEHPTFISDRQAQIEDIKTKLYENNPDLFLERLSEDDKSEKNDIVFNVVVGDVDEKLFCGISVNNDNNPNQFPNRIVPLKLPKESPSRAWLKIEEAMHFVKLKYPDLEMEAETANIVVEIGSAPGGACYSLLQRNYFVYGVDPLPPDRQHADIVRKHKNFKEIKGTLQSVTRAQLPSVCHWLTMDANISPTEALPKLILIMNHYAQHLRGVFYTVKLNDEFWDRENEMINYLDDIKQKIKEEVKSCEDIVFTQLSSNRKEVLCFIRCRSG